jgi:group II intron reverse transcriptase/maturase
MSLPTPPETVQKLQQSLHAKAKTEPSYRFYSLWDKVCRMDVLRYAYRACRANGGAAGVDGETFEQIEAGGLEEWLGNLQQELRSKTYAPQPLLRVWIPKRSGGQRPLGIPCIRDRAVQAAALVVIEPIFEPDLPNEQFGFRKGRDGKRAVRQVRFHLNKRGRTDVVDADLSDYFNTIPHGRLMKCVGRRVSDRSALGVMKRWLIAPVVERRGRQVRQTTENRDTSRGTPQGGVISPLLANLYFRRFVLAWRHFGYQHRLNAHIVNYADDLVICCRPGAGAEAMMRMRETMRRLGLTVNERKTKLVVMSVSNQESFDFLGYTFGRLYRRDARPYLGIRPSPAAISRILGRIRDETSQTWARVGVHLRVEAINSVVRGWCNYFDQGAVYTAHRKVTRHLLWRFRRWLMKKHKRRGSAARQFPMPVLREMGLYLPPYVKHDRSSAKARGFR